MLKNICGISYGDDEGLRTFLETEMKSPRKKRLRCTSVDQAGVEIDIYDFPEAMLEQVPDPLFRARVQSIYDDGELLFTKRFSELWNTVVTANTALRPLEHQGGMIDLVQIVHSNLHIQRPLEREVDNALYLQISGDSQIEKHTAKVLSIASSIEELSLGQLEIMSEVESFPSKERCAAAENAIKQTTGIAAPGFPRTTLMRIIIYPTDSK